jgi:hypothetical protein
VSAVATQPPADLLAEHGLAKDSWELLGSDLGIAATTWMSRDRVLQRRPAAMLRRWQLQQQTMAPLRERDELRGAWATLLDHDESWFWIVAERLPGEVISPESDTWENAWRVQLQVWPQLIEQMRLIRDLPLEPELDSQATTPGLVAQLLTVDQLAAEVVRLLPNGQAILERLPAEPMSAPTISHGDPIIKNAVVAEGRAHYIDWECFSVLPAQRDPTHLTAYMCNFGPIDHWDEVIATGWTNSQTLLPHFDEGSWRAACLWYIVREVIAYPKPERITHVAAGLARLLALPDPR